MSDLVSWILDAVLRPARPAIDSVMIVDLNRVAFHFNAKSNLDYALQSRNNLGPGLWSTLQDFSSVSTNRTLWVTNNVSGVQSRFYRLIVGP